jgi:D-serine dehydratase
MTTVTSIVCYTHCMTQSTKEILRRVETWPEEDQKELAEVAREIEARRSGVYVLDKEEELAIREGLAQLDRGEWMSEEDMKAFWKRCGIL